jgi:hypothetical protein
MVKIIFSSAFILSFNFINFYSLCRGYGISIALLILAMYYFFIYTRYYSFTHFAKFILCSQLALSANLTLVLVLAITTVVIVVHHLRQKLFLRWRNILVLFLHFGLLAFWVKYAFYLKEQGALYYGSGDSYWTVTFKTLIETMSFPSPVINGVVLFLFFTMLAGLVVKLYRYRAAPDLWLKSNFVLSYLMLIMLIAAFYLLKKLFHVNYPEDRTGLFFYVFFMLALAFMINELPVFYQYGFLFIPAFFIVHFIVFFNIRVHAWAIYETMPHEFFSILRSEQDKSPGRITIAGHRVREFFYGFMNYTSSRKLNHITSPEALQMNCDYALAYKKDKPYYDKYYDELDSDEYWDFMLLKRKVPLQRMLLAEVKSPPEFVNDYEYYNAYEKLDTTFNDISPLQAEFNFDVDRAPLPFNAWLVIQVDGVNADSSVLVRTPLNLVTYNWNGRKNFTLDLVTGNIPIRIRRIVAYLWNIDKQQIKIKVNYFRLYQLHGPGVTEISKAKL